MIFWMHLRALGWMEIVIACVCPVIWMRCSKRCRKSRERANFRTKFEMRAYFKIFPLRFIAIKKKTQGFARKKQNEIKKLSAIF